MSEVRDHILSPTSKGPHDVRSIVIGSWAREICGFNDGIRLDGSRVEVHKFDVGLARDKLLIGAQAGRQSLDEGFGGGVERDTGNGKFRRERAVENDEDRVGEGGLAEGGEESAGEKVREERIPPDNGKVIIFRPFLESDSFTRSQYQYQDDYEGLRPTFWPRGKPRQRC